MKTVYKYSVPKRLHKFSILLPLNFKFIRVAHQNDALFLWAEVSKGEPTIEKKFVVYGTGQDIQDGATYLTTYDDGPFVFHIYQIP